MIAVRLDPSDVETIDRLAVGATRSDTIRRLLAKGIAVETLDQEKLKTRLRSGGDHGLSFMQAKTATAAMVAYLDGRADAGHPVPTDPPAVSPT